MPEGYHNVSLPVALVARLDELLANSGGEFRSRPEIVAQAIREFITRREARVGDAVFMLGLLVAIPDAEIYRARDLVSKGRADEAVAHLAGVLREMERRAPGPAGTPPRSARGRAVDQHK